jgi:hypothetical protein
MQPILFDKVAAMLGEIILELGTRSVLSSIERGKWRRTQHSQIGRLSVGSNVYDGARE